MFKFKSNPVMNYNTERPLNPLENPKKRLYNQKTTK
jgi:hypothetical protein